MANEGRVFNLKPELTLAMKLAASFAITYYGLLFIYEVVALCLCHYSIDSYYLDGERWSTDILYLIAEFVFSGLLVFSLIQIFRKKLGGKGIFVGASLLLIVFQLITAGFFPWYKYALEVLLLLIIAPIRVKKLEQYKPNRAEKEATKEEVTNPASGSKES